MVQACCPALVDVDVDHYKLKCVHLINLAYAVLIGRLTIN